MLKTCTKCLRDLEQSEFNWKVKDVRRAVHCRECSRAYIRAHYNKNTEYYLKKARKSNQIIREKVKKFLGDYLIMHPCVDCGEKDIVVLEFDHKNRNDKEFEVGLAIQRGYGVKKIEKELRKCDIRCANCHRRKTARENNNWKSKFGEYTSPP